MIRIAVTTLLIIAVTCALASAQEDTIQVVTDTLSDSALAVIQPEVPSPAGKVLVNDTPNDNGGSVQINWTASADDTDGRIERYEIERKEVNASDDTYKVIGDATAGQTRITDNYAENGVEYVYRVVAVSLAQAGDGEMLEVKSYSESSAIVKASAQWFNTNRTVVLIFALVIGSLIVNYISQARKGKDLFIRKIAGLEAVDEAVGRATEMGKKIYYVPGTQDMENIQTIAGVTILGRVARLAAQYETDLDVPVSRSLVMVTAREIVKEAYMNVGRPDAFHEDTVHYLTDDQFGYAAAIDGMVVREKPATIFYMGAFYAESLILAETGNSIGAIQIAGTAMPAQLPFFVAACDYTLIGEELFAASAYLSKEPKLLGSLKGQDISKGLILAVIAIGVIIQTLGVYDFASLFRIAAD